MKSALTRCAGILVATALPVASTAQQAPPCLTAQEANGLMQFALPEVLNSAVEKCRPALGADAFLVHSGSQLVERYRTASSASWPAAKAAFLKVAGDSSKFLEALPDDANKAFLNAAIGEALGKGIKPEQCGPIDRGVAALSPLPISNLADLTVLILELSGGGKSGNSPLKVCPALAGKPVPVNRPTATTASPSK